MWPVINNMLSNQKYIGYIISFDKFFIVQGSNLDEYTGKRKDAWYSSKNVLRGLFVCAECGTNSPRITQPSGEVVWRCASRMELGRSCKHSPSITETQIKEDLCELLDMDSFSPSNLIQSWLRSPTTIEYLRYGRRSTIPNFRKMRATSSLK